MMVKTCVLAAVAALLSVSAFAQGAASAGTKPLTAEERKARQEAFKKLPPEEQAKIIAERKHRAYVRTGGRIRNVAQQKGRILVVNAQGTVDAAPLREAVRKLADYLKIEISFEDGQRVDLAAARDFLRTKNANAVICLGEYDGNSPLLVAPDDSWASVNLKALGEKNLDARTKKELARAFVFLCGGTGSGYNNPLMRPMRSVDDLDGFETVDIPVDVLQRISPYLQSMGVTPYAEGSYRSACRAGWAPLPTNDVQRAIWNEIHEIPSDPIKIKKQK